MRIQKTPENLLFVVSGGYDIFLILMSACSLLINGRFTWTDEYVLWVFSVGGFVGGTLVALHIILGLIGAAVLFISILWPLAKKFADG